MKYVSVIGTGVTGSLTGGQDRDSDSKRGEENGLIHRLESLVAYSSYSVLSGEGEGSLGDGKLRSNNSYCGLKRGTSLTSMFLRLFILSHLHPSRHHSSSMCGVVRGRGSASGGTCPPLPDILPLTYPMICTCSIQ